MTRTIALALVVALGLGAVACSKKKPKPDPCAVYDFDRNGLIGGPDFTVLAQKIEAGELPSTELEPFRKCFIASGARG